MLPNIIVDDDKCENPLACRKCLLACPTYVLAVGPNVLPQKFKEIDPNQYVVRGLRLQACTGCMECIRACPANAIQVTFSGGKVV